MAVIEDNGVVSPSFTSREYVSAKNGVVVTTQVPSNNVFDYNSPEAVLGISGGLLVKKCVGANCANFDPSEEASFAIEVSLQPTLQPTTGVASYIDIEACTCEGVSFVCHNNALMLNADLIVCIKSTSSDVEIDFLDRMVSATAIYDIW